MKTFSSVFWIILIAASCPRSPASDDKFLDMFAQMYGAYVGRPGNKFQDFVGVTRPYDYVMEHHSISDWSYAEKSRLAFMVLTTIQLGSAGAPEFVRWMGKDAQRIGRELDNVSDTDLVQAFGFSEDRIKHFRFIVDLLIKNG